MYVSMSSVHRFYGGYEIVLFLCRQVTGAVTDCVLQID